jgi:YgiT-type zinc finger domain-containing protein
MSRSERPDMAAVDAALRAWQRAHPTATLLEIEQAVDRQLGALRAALIGATAADVETDAIPACPACGRRMHRDRVRTVQQATAHGGTLALTGQAWRCPVCGTGLFPPR